MSTKKKIIRVRKEKISLTEEQMIDFLNTIKNERKKHSSRNHLMAKVWFATGLRVSEMANFQVQWMIKADEYYIHIKQNDKPFAFKPKYGSTRKIPIPKKLYNEILEHLGNRKTGYVFMPQTKKTYAKFHSKSLISLYNDYFIETKSISRNLGSHTFRRTFASHLATSKPPVPIPKISEYLGHTRISTTIGYLKKIKTDDHTEIMGSDYLKDLINL